MSNEQFMKERELIISDLVRKLRILKRSNTIKLIFFGLGYWLYFLNYLSHVFK